MRSVAEKLRVFHRKPFPNLSFPSPIRDFNLSTTTDSAAASASALTDDEIKQINAVIPRLCSTNHLKEAVNLISAAITTANPPLSSLPLPTLVNRLALEPDLTHPMHLLNALKHNPTTGNPQFLLPIARMFVASFFRHGGAKKAVKIFQWTSRPDFPGGEAKDSGFYADLINGFCKNGMILEALRVLREMAGENLVIGDEIRVWVYRGLLKEARVREALEMNAALGGGTVWSDGGTLNGKEVVDLLDRMIANWEE